MLKYFILFSIVIAPFLTANSFAQNDDSLAIDSMHSTQAGSFTDKNWKKTVESIKQDTENLLEANQKLNSEYEFLKQKLADLQSNFAVVKEENTKLEMQNQKLTTSRTAQRQSFGQVQQKMLNAQSEIGDLDAKSKPLRENLAKLEEQNAQMQAKLQELQGQKRKLLLDLKLQEAAHGDQPYIDDEETQKFNAQLSKYQTQEKELNDQFSESQKEMEDILVDIEKINQENNKFQNQLAALRAKKDNQLKINEQLRSENERLAKSQGPGNLLKQKRALETKIASLSKELDVIRRSVQDSSAVLEKKRGQMDKVMKLDADNQTLRDQVAELLQKINDLKTTSDDPEESAQPFDATQ